MDSGNELNEQDPSLSITHRSPTRSGEPGNEEEEIILDQDQQQKVIDNLNSDFERMVKYQKYSFRFLTLLLSSITVFASYSTGNYQILLPAAASYLSLLLADFLLASNKKFSSEKSSENSNSNIQNFLKNWWIWALTLVFEFYSLFASYKYGILTDEIKKLPLIILHAGYLILLFFLSSLQNFSQSFPNEIQNLQNHKYGSKLA